MQTCQPAETPPARAVTGSRALVRKAGKRDGAGPARRGRLGGRAADAAMGKVPNQLQVPFWRVLIGDRGRRFVIASVTGGGGAPCSNRGLFLQGRPVRLWQQRGLVCRPSCRPRGEWRFPRRLTYSRRHRKAVFGALRPNTRITDKCPESRAGPIVVGFFVTLKHRFGDLNDSMKETEMTLLLSYGRYKEGQVGNRDQGRRQGGRGRRCGAGSSQRRGKASAARTNRTRAGWPDTPCFL